MNVLIISFIASLAIIFFLLRKISWYNSQLKEVTWLSNDTIQLKQNRINTLENELFLLTEREAIFAERQDTLDKGYQAMAQTAVMPLIVNHMEKSLVPIAENMALKPVNEQLTREVGRLNSSYSSLQKAYDTLLLQYKEQESKLAFSQKQAREAIAELNDQAKQRLRKAAHPAQKSRAEEEKAAHMPLTSRAHAAHLPPNPAQKAAHTSRALGDAAFSPGNDGDFAQIQENSDSLVWPRHDNFFFREVYEGEGDQFYGKMEIVSRANNKVIFEFDQNKLVPGVRYFTTSEVGYLLLCGMHGYEECDTVVISTQPNQKCCSAKGHKDKFRRLSKGNNVSYSLIDKATG